MKIRLSAATIALVLASSVAQAADEKPAVDLVARGKMLVTLGGCHDCHTPKTFGPEGMAPDMTRQLSGSPGTAKLPPMDKQALTPGYWYLAAPDLTAWVGPWGVSFAMNLTPDDQTGIGLWKEDLFIKTLRTGKHLGEGRQILPPMPWQYFKQLPDEDLKAIWAYLRSIPAIKNQVPSSIAPPDVK